MMKRQTYKFALESVLPNGSYLGMVCCAVFLLLVNQALSATNVFEWVRIPSGPDEEVATAIAVDPGGNSYVTGYFGEYFGGRFASEIPGQATFGSTNITSAGSDDIFIAKYDSAGLLQWVRTAGGPAQPPGSLYAQSWDRGLSIALDRLGNAYVTGFMGPGVFVAKYTSDGASAWVRNSSIDPQIGGSTSGNSIAVDPEGNSYVTGDFQSSLTIGEIELVAPFGQSDIFVAKGERNNNLSK